MVPRVSETDNFFLNVQKYKIGKQHKARKHEMITGDLE